MSAFTDLVPESARACAQVTFSGIADSKGETHSCSTSDWNLIPVSTLYFEPFTERTSTVEVPGFHGSLLQPEFGYLNSKVSCECRTFDPAKGSWDFYYVGRGQSGSLWDYYPGMLSIAEKTALREGRMDGNASGFFAMYHEMMRHLQGRRCDMTIQNSISDAGETFHGRAWVSAVKPDNEGKIVVTISYEIQPGTPYDKFCEKRT